MRVGLRKLVEKCLSYDSLSFLPMHSTEVTLAPHILLPRVRISVLETKYQSEKISVRYCERTKSLRANTNFNDVTGRDFKNCFISVKTSKLTHSKMIDNLSIEVSVLG